MANMMDYLDWRGDLTLSCAPWCPVDSLIMASFSYNPLDERAAGETGLTLKELAPDLPLRDMTGNQYFQQWKSLLYAMADTVRFGDIVLHDYVDVVDDEREMQFSAVTAELPDGMTYVAFRGTDNTLVGWREDFNMSFESPVPAQQAAMEYLERAGMRARRGLLVGGHSKGGNLAAYAAAHASPKTQAMLRGVYSFDGPGLDDVTMASAGYARMKPVLWSIIPQSSVVGLLMNYHTDYTVVHSTAVSLLQHDAFTWQVKGTHFEEMQAVDLGSRLMDQTVHDWLKQCGIEQRKVFVDTMFRLLEATNAKTVADLTGEKLKSAAAVIGATHGMDADTRRMFNHLLAQFLTIGASNAWEMITAKPRYTIVSIENKLKPGAGASPLDPTRAFSPGPDQRA